MWQDGTRPAQEPSATAPFIERAKKDEKNLGNRPPRHDSISRNTSEELTSALSLAIRNVTAKCYTVGELSLRPLP